MAKQNEVQSRPWYKEPMVWLAISIPLSAVVYGIFFLTVSITSFDGMVVDDYYKVGKQINRELKRDKAAQAHGLRAQLSVDGETLVVFIASNPDYSPTPALEISFFYSTRADIDKETFVEQTSPGIYKGPMPKLETGRWNVQIASDDWRLLGSLRAPEETKVIISPQVK